jgi:ubiquinone/menaquinone biosynthesis C-methylase UbiE
MTTSNWWRTYFDEEYFRQHDALFSERTSRREVAGMMELLALPDGARVLDAPCGWGRHTTLLAEAGCDAFGADISFDLLRHAPAENARYVAADIRALPYADATFDAVVNVFSSLGLFLTDEDDVAALREARRLLKPGGAILLETMHRDDIMAAYADRDSWFLENGTEVRVRRRFNPVTGISEERLSWRRGNERGRKSHAMRLRTGTEVLALLRAAGFEQIDWYGNWNGAPFTHRSESLIAVARP